MHVSHTCVLLRDQKFANSQCMVSAVYFQESLHQHLVCCPKTVFHLPFQESLKSLLGLGFLRFDIINVHPLQPQVRGNPSPVQVAERLLCVRSWGVAEAVTAPGPELPPVE